jgi:hypothetical protein
MVAMRLASNRLGGRGRQALREDQRGEGENEGELHLEWSSPGLNHEVFQLLLHTVKMGCTIGLRQHETAAAIFIPRSRL